VLNVHLTDQTLATGQGVVRTDHPTIELASSHC